MRIATLSMIFSCLLLAGHAAQAQQARCTDNNGMGYACGGSAARSAIQSGHTGGMPHREPRATYMDPSQRSQYTGRQIALLIDIEKKMREGKGRGYQVWAERHNLDAVSQSIIYLKENGINSYEELMSRIDSGTKRRNQLLTIKM